MYVKQVSLDGFYEWTPKVVHHKRDHCHKNCDLLPVNLKDKFMHVQDACEKEDGEMQYWVVSGQKRYIQSDGYNQEISQETTEKI